MSNVVDRRDFIAAGLGVAAGIAIGSRGSSALAAPAGSPAGGASRGAPAGSPARAMGAEATGFKTWLKKALIVNKPTEDELKRLRDAGYHGVEAGVLDVGDAAACRAAAEKVGMKIHSVLRGWAEFNSSDQAKREASIALTEKAILAAQAFGADAVLLVPCRIGGMSMPRPWEFHIDFDPETNRIRTVTVGDNAPFEEYIRAHNHAIDTSREAVKRLIPVAERAGVAIALENVWNNLWVRPAIFASFVASFKSPWVKAYYDIGNHVKYAPSEEWILALGGLIAKCHVKDFLLDPSDPNGGGTWARIREGSVRWPVVRAALERVGYSGWMTIEDDKLSVEEHSRRLDLIIEGK